MKKLIRWNNINYFLLLSVARILNLKPIRKKIILAAFIGSLYSLIILRSLLSFFAFTSSSNLASKYAKRARFILSSSIFLISSNMRYKNAFPFSGTLAKNPFKKNSIKKIRVCGFYPLLRIAHIVLAYRQKNTYENTYIFIGIILLVFRYTARRWAQGLAL